MPFNAYIEHNGVDIQQDFEDLYKAMHSKTLREKDQVIDGICLDPKLACRLSHELIIS